MWTPFGDVVISFKKNYTHDGVAEIPDPTPIDVPLKYRQSESMEEKIQRLIRSEAFRIAHGEDKETYDEANDFDIDDDEDVVIYSPHEFTELDEDAMMDAYANLHTEHSRVKSELDEKERYGKRGQGSDSAPRKEGDASVGGSGSE